MPSQSVHYIISANHATSLSKTYKMHNYPNKPISFIKLINANYALNCLCHDMNWIKMKVIDLKEIFVKTCFKIFEGL